MANMVIIILLLGFQIVFFFLSRYACLLLFGENGTWWVNKAMSKFHQGENLEMTLI